MKMKLLGCALLGALGVANVAAAQDYDDRWYVTGTTGLYAPEHDHVIDDAPIFGLGIGKFISPKFSVDFDLTATNPSFPNNDLHWNSYGLMVNGRYHFNGDGDRTVWPYVVAGVGALRHGESFENPNGLPLKRESNNLAAQLGVGFQADAGRVAVRSEVLLRGDFDDSSYSAPRENVFTDLIAQLSLVVKLGNLAEPAPAQVVEVPAEPEITCADLDDDGDGVNNCEDKCPNSTAGQAIGPDGCPVAISIDLRGVNFDFDKATLRPDSIATLNEAVAVLNQYPDLRVEVAGHTDECGNDAYNLKLSQARAKAVYDYLVQNGIAASRLVGPNGYGEDRPLESLGDAFPACKSETNRRTELNVQ
jgi:OOP family OmpA-OmpF porin